MPPENNNKPESGLWKDYLNRASISKIAGEIGRVHKGFDQSSFVESLSNDAFSRLELKQRIFKIAEALRDFLPTDYSRVMNIFRKIAPNLGGFENWALMSYIELFGLEHFDISVDAMRDLTQYSSAEFAIRPYVNRDPAKMLSVMSMWAENSNEHIRRLAAEGSRPRGVWTAHIEQFKKDPRPVIKLLEKLKADESLYVRKAVANNLNDISKDHPALVIKTATVWQKDRHKHTDWIIKHACRTLIKKGDPRVFSLLGFTANPKIALRGLTLSPKKIKIGSDATISFEVVSLGKSAQKLAIDYRIHFVKKSGKLSPKVFKLTEKKLAADGVLAIATKHSLRNHSTRTHLPGKHQLDIVVNGKVFETVEFRLI
ncbi:MAG: DNA alkylation repair protein [Candidatus Zixiibacteriota bacterium]